MITRLTPEEARALLTSRRVGRLGCVDDGGPYVIPVNYVVSGDEIYIHSLPGRKIEALRANPKACLQVDDVIDSYHWRSAIAFGTYEEITDRGTRDLAVQTLICAFETTFSGSEVNLGIRDDGVWSGHPDLSGTFLAGSDFGLNKSHGTHTSSTIIGRGTRDIEGTYDAKGIAYSARLLFKNSDTSYSSALSAFKDSGVQVSNHSYKFSGSSEFVYDSATETYDAYADNEDMVLAMAAGNDGDYPTNPGIAKNTLAVAALTYVTNSSETIGRHASYSNVGPTRDDFRLKPDLAAPGGGSSLTYGVVAANNQPNGVSTGNEWESDDYYTRNSGTSMAAPHVTGVLGKMRQWGTNLHSEILKALLINTTIPVKDNSSDALAAYATTRVGYGMANAFSVTTQYTGESDRLLFGEDWVTEDQKTDNWTISVPSGTKNL